MKFEIQDLETMTAEEEMIAGLKANIQTVSALRKEIDKLQKATIPGFCETLTSSHESSTITPQSEYSYSVDEDFESEVEYYFSDLRKLNTLEKESIKQILPTKKHLQYNRLMYRLQAELLKENNDVVHILETAEESFTKEDLRELREEILMNQRKIELVEEIRKTEERKDEEEDDLNHFIFVPTTAGNIYVLEDLKDIAQEYNSNFLELFESIKNGTFKNVKRFTNNGILDGISEVRGYQSRILFDRIGAKEYAIIYAFVKKTDNDKGYKDSIKSRVINYRQQQSTMIENLAMEEYRTLNEQLTETLYGRLKETKNKDLQKRIKGGTL